LKVSVLTDEISQDPATAMELASDWGARWVEFRSIYGKRVPDDDLGARRALRELMDTFGVKAAAVTPGIFKVPLRDRDAIRSHLEDRLPRSIEFARMVGTSLIIIFTPILEGEPDGDDLEFFRQRLSKAIDLAEREGFTLAVENEPVCLVATGDKLGEFARGMGSSALRVNWDPGNAFYSGEDPLDGYAHVRDLVSHVHLKDVSTDASGTKTFVPIGSGETGILEQLRMLKEDGYTGCLTIETHFTPKVSGTKRCLDGLKVILSRIGDSME
jgi:sugar phosphate isomerase/epimerase